MVVIVVMTTTSSIYCVLSVCYGLNFVSLRRLPPPPYSYVEVLIPNVIVFGDTDFRQVIKVKWGHKGGPWSHRISVLIRRGRDNKALSLHRRQAMCGHREKVANCKPARESSPETEFASNLTMDFQSPELWENKCLLFKSPICNILLWQPNQTNTVCIRSYSKCFLYFVFSITSYHRYCYYSLIIDEGV